MKHAKRYLCTLIMAAMLISSLAACSIGSNKVKISEYPNTVVAKYGDQPIYLDEVYYLVKVSQVTYDYYYSILGGNTPIAEWYDSVSPLFGSENLTTWNLIRENVFRTIYQTRVLCDQAQKLGITLNDEDMKKINDAVAEAMKEGNRTIVDAARASEELLRNIYKQNALAVKVYDKISEGYDTNIVRDEYKTALVTYFSVTKDTKDETDEKAKAEAILAAVNEEIKKLAEAKTEDKKEDAAKADDKKDEDKKEEEKTIDFAAIKTKLTDGSDVKNPVTFSLYQKQNVGISKTMTDLEKAVWSMKVGEAKLVDSTSMYYVVYLLDDDDTEAVDKKIENALKERKEAKFSEEYKKILETAPKLEVLDKIYEANIKYEDIKYPEATTAAPTTAPATTAAATTEAATTTTAAATTEAATTEAAATEAADTTEETAAEEDEVTTEAAEEEEISTEAVAAEE